MAKVLLLILLLSVAFGWWRCVLENMVLQVIRNNYHLIGGLKGIKANAMIDNGKGTVINIASIGAFVAVAVRLYLNYHLIMALKVLKQTPLHLVLILA